MGDFMKSILRKIHQWYCNHEIVSCKSKAHWTHNANQRMLVTCTICGKKWYEYGKDIAFKWSREKECHCEFRK